MSDEPPSCSLQNPKANGMIAAKTTSCQGVA